VAVTQWPVRTLVAAAAGSRRPTPKFRWKKAPRAEDQHRG
jgi:hypothetical protein